MQHRFVASNPSLPLLTLNKFLNCFSLLYFWLFQVQMKIRLFASCCPSTHTKSTSLLLPITPWKIYHVPHFTHQIYRERHCHVTHITFWSGLEQLTWTSVGEWRPVTISCCALVWLWFVKSVNRLHILYNDYLKTWAQIDDNEITMTFCFTKFKGGPGVLTTFLNLCMFSVKMLQTVSCRHMCVQSPRAMSVKPCCALLLALFHLRMCLCCCKNSGKTPTLPSQTIFKHNMQRQLQVSHL